MSVQKHIQQDAKLFQILTEEAQITPTGFSGVENLTPDSPRLADAHSKAK